MELAVNWTIWAVAMTLRCCCSLCETSLFASDKLELARRSQQGNRGAERALALLEDANKVLSSLLVATNLMMVIATVSAANISLILQPFGANSAAVTTVIMIILVLYATEIIPKGYAVRAPEAIASFFALPLSLALVVLRPISSPFNALSAFIIHSSDRPAYEERQDDDAIITLAEIGSEAGQISEDTEEMIAAVLTSDDRPVREVMCPRIDISALDVDAPWADILDTMEHERYSRWPVYEQDIDNIIGLLYRRDLLPLLLHNAEPQVSVREVMRDALFVPESKLISVQIQEMREASCHMAIILDEYGSTAGMVTLEALLEEVFGDIQDETDTEESLPLQIMPDGVLVDGLLPLGELEDLFQLKQSLPTEQYDTVGGFVYGVIGYVPKQGETLLLAEYGLVVVVRQLEGYRLRQLWLQQDESDPQQIEEEGEKENE